MKKLLPLLLVLGCGDNIRPEPPLTWRDAQESWADAWCTYAERCFPVIFSIKFGDLETCLADVVELNCDPSYSSHDCDMPYPEDRYDDLERCHDEVAGIDCSATEVPDVCYLAFK